MERDAQGRFKVAVKPGKNFLGEPVWDVTLSEAEADLIFFLREGKRPVDFFATRDGKENFSLAIRKAGSAEWRENHARLRSRLLSFLNATHRL